MKRNKSFWNWCKNGFILQKMSVLALAVLFIISHAMVSCTGRPVNLPKEAVKTPGRDSLPVMVFEHDFANLGKMDMGEKAGVDFIFTNTGGSNLVILSVETSCGCTVPEWDKKPVPPGQKGKIRVVFDSSGAAGMQNKSIRVISNAKIRETDLMISAEVKLNE